MAKVTTLISRYWLHLLGINGVVMTAAFCSAALSPRVWTSSAQLILPDATTNLDASLGTLGQLRDQGVAFTNELSPLKVQASIITSDDVIRPVWSNDPERDQFQTLSSYKKLFKVRPADQSTTIGITVEGSAPELAEQRARSIIESYQQRVDALRQGTSAARLKFSQEQLIRAENTLNRAKNALAEFQRSTGLVNSEEQTKQMVQSINTLLTAQAQVAAEGKAAVTRKNNLTQRLGLTPEQALQSLRLSENKEYQTIREKLSEVDADLAEKRGLYTDDNPQIQALLLQQQELQTALKQQLAEVVPNGQGVDTNFGGNPYRDGTVDLISQLIQAEGDSKALRDQATSIQRQVEDLKQGLTSISTQQAQLLDLQRQYNIAEGVYKGIVAQLEQAKITAFNAYPNVQVLDQPSVDPKPTSPRRSTIALGALLASIFGSGALVAYLESRSTLMKPRDIHELESPVLVRIPPLKQSARALNGTGAADIEFQRLASAISLMPLPNHQLLVSSSKAGEGKTTVTLGLAMALTDLGFRVLVVDGDFHKAELSRRLGYEMTEELSALPAPKRISLRLDLLPATAGMDSKMIKFLARGQFEQHLNTIQISGGYDYVIVDSAPVGLTSETALMAKAIRNVLLVVRLGISDRPMVQETVEQLIRHDSQIIGLAVNGAEQRLEGYGYKQSTARVDA